MYALSMYPIEGDFEVSCRLTTTNFVILNYALLSCKNANFKKQIYPITLQNSQNL